MKKKTKTLGDYISSGRHEFVAFIRDMVSSRGTVGSKLGETHFGVIVCDRENWSDAKFFHKSDPIYRGDSDISQGIFSYDAKVISELPLSLEIHSFYNEEQLKLRSNQYREAKKLLKKHGLF